MSCPLAALANIAALTASALPPAPALEPVRRADISATSPSSPPLSQESAPFPATTPGVVASPSTRPASRPSGARASRPMKKRAVQPYPCEGRSPTSCPVGMPDRGVAAKPIKKARKMVPRSDPSPRGDGTAISLSTSASRPFEMKADQPSFPVVLLAIMSAPQNRDVITFLSDGRSFIVVHPDAMANNVLPLHFAGDVPTYDQFLGLLKLWGFDTITDPQYPEVNVFRHPLFRDGDWEACLEMKLPGGTKAEDGIPSIGSWSATGLERAPSDGSFWRRPASPRRARAKRGPASPRLLKAGKARQPAPVKARSVTPPENVATRRDEIQAESQLWIMRSSSTLKQMTLATAETRRRLSLSIPRLSLSGPRLAPVARSSSEEAALGVRPDLSALYLHHAMHELSIRPCSPPEELAATINACPESRRRHTETQQLDLVSLAARTPGLESAQMTSGLTDAQVKLVTNDVVSAAVAALNAGYNVDARASPPPISHLDAMTEAFLERSNARRMQSRPTGIFIGLLDARSRAGILSQQQGWGPALVPPGQYYQ